LAVDDLTYLINLIHSIKHKPLICNPNAMAANFHQPSVHALLDAMSEPLLTFGVSGLVTFANRAAQAHPGHPVESMSGSPTIKALVGDAVLGKLQLPFTTEIELTDGLRIKGQFMPGPAGLDIAFVGTSGAGVGQDQRMGLKDIMGLLQAEVNPPLKGFISELRTRPASPIHSSLDQAARLLYERLSRLADLIMVFGEDVALSNDRMELIPLLQEVCGELTYRADIHNTRFEMIVPEQPLPPIYGSERLLRSAFFECLNNAVIHAHTETGQDVQATVEIRFTLSGEHVMVGIHNQGATQFKLNSKDMLTPFAQPSASMLAKGPPPRLGLPLVQRIVDLHGGNMRLNSSVGKHVNMLLEFPTGAPQRATNQLNLAQAQRYAADLAQLVSRRKKDHHEAQSTDR
jgi:nitrogen-specific signal transduction histidine kinase